MVAPGFMQAFILLGILVVLVVVCILFQGRPRPEAYSHEELTQIRIDRELAKEEVLEEKAHQLKGRARIHRRNRLILSARKDADLILESAQEQWDARGRSIYGDAWDDPQDGNLPLRTLFNLPGEEIEIVKEEARRLLQPDWPRSDDLPLPSPPNHLPYADDRADVLSIEKRVNEQDGHTIMTAPACREPTYGGSSTLSKTGARFVDARFVHLPTPAIVPPLDFARLGNGARSPSLPEIYQSPTAAAAGASCPIPNPEATTRRKNVHTSAGPTAMTTAANYESTINSKKQDRPEHSSLAVSTSIQDPGLRYPRPPSIPPPKAKRAVEGIPLLGRKSLSARLANFAAAGTTGRVVPIELV